MRNLAALAAVGRRETAPDAAVLLSAMPVPVVLLGADDRFRFVNHAAEEFLGVSAVGLDDKPESTSLTLPPAEEKKKILDLFRN